MDGGPRQLGRRHLRDGLNAKDPDPRPSRPRSCGRCAHHRDTWSDRGGMDLRCRIGSQLCGQFATVDSRLATAIGRATGVGRRLHPAAIPYASDPELNAARTASRHVA